MAFGGVIAAGDKRYRRLRKRELERASGQLSGKLQTAS
jgi:hypothetical protein